MFCIELVVGKDRPCEIPKPARDEYNPIIKLLLRLTKLLYGTGKYNHIQILLILIQHRKISYVRLRLLYSAGNHRVNKERSMCFCTN